MVAMLLLNCQGRTLLSEYIVCMVQMRIRLGKIFSVRYVQRLTQFYPIFSWEILILLLIQSLTGLVVTLRLHGPLPALNVWRV